MTSLIHYRPLSFIAKASSTSPSRLVPNPPDLIKWVKLEGGFVHQSIQISEDSNGLGLFAAQPIPKDSPLIVLPSHIPLKFGPFSPNRTLDAPISTLIELALKIPDELWAMKLGLKLLHERAKSDSFWWPYISNLPETFTVPIFFGQDDVKGLQYAPLIFQVKKRCTFLLESETTFGGILDGLPPKDHPFGGQKLESSSLAWAMSAVSSRAFKLHGDKLPDGTRAGAPMMLPLIDMCNHSFNPNSRIQQELDAGTATMLVKVFAEKDIKRSDPLLLNYGSLSNDLLLLDYGFVAASNPHDCIDLKYDEALLEAASSEVGIFSPFISSPKPWQKEILSELKLIGGESNPKVSIGGEEVVEGRLLAAVRVLLCEDEEAAKKQRLETLKSLSAEEPLGAANELAALHTIVGLCGILRRCFPTREMDDREFLKGSPSDYQRLAVEFRYQKKRVISEVVKHLSTKLKPLIEREEGKMEN